MHWNHGATANDGTENVPHKESICNYCFNAVKKEKNKKSMEGIYYKLEILISKNKKLINARQYLPNNEVFPQNIHHWLMLDKVF